MAARIGCLLVTALVLITPCGVEAQELAPMLKPDAFEITELADGVHAVIRKDPLDDAANANVLVIVNERDVVVVDGNLTPSSSEATIAAIRKLTPNPVRYVINTHWHDDHVIGNSAYADAFPGDEFIGHAFTREQMLGPVAASLEENRTAYAKALADVEGLIEKGVGAGGKPMTAQARTANVRLAQLYRAFLAEMPRMRIVAPDLLVKDGLTIRRGDREIRVLFLGRGNTAGDLVVHLPKEGIVATGDLLVHPVPFAFGSYPGEWSGALARLEALQPRLMMPGHGALLRDMTFLTAVRETLVALTAQMREAVAKGMTLEQARAALDLKAYEARMPGGNFMGMFVIPASERAYLEARGEIKD